MVGLSLAATLLAIALVVGLLAWVGRDLRARGAPARVWWLVVACYGFAALAWLLAIRLPLPVILAWLATIPAAVATVVPERMAAGLDSFGRVRGPRRARRPHTQARSTTSHRTMARPVRGASRTSIGGGSSAVRASAARGPEPDSGGTTGIVHGGTSHADPWRPEAPAPSPTSSPPRGTVDAPLSPAVRTLDVPVSPVSTAEVSSRRSLAIGRRRWQPGDLRLAVELLEDAARIPDLDDAARARIEARLGRLDRFREGTTQELLAMVRDDVHARLASETPTLDPDPERALRIAVLLDELDPIPDARGT